MATNVDLHYLPGSFVGPLDEAEVSKFEQWLWASGDNKIIFDRSYIDYLSRFHGGIPGTRFFRTKLGTQLSIKRFLNFLPSSGTNSLKEYNVPGTWSSYDDRMGDYLMPFAALPCGDFLCFAYDRPGRPTVVAWFHEKSMPDEIPYTELVADNFDEFLSMLTEKS